MEIRGIRFHNACMPRFEGGDPRLMEFSMPYESQRPPPEKRTFTSPVIEAAIGETAARIKDPELAWLFTNCFPNTLDTTVQFTPDDGSGRPDTFIITGDIAAMWLRDSTNQVWPYLPFAKECPKLRDLFRGLIRRQAKCVLLDPYANAFYRDSAKISQWKSDHTEMKPGVHERKYELDSLASVLRLATGYYEVTGDSSPFDDEFLQAVRLIVDTIRYEQAGTPEQIHPRYSFGRTTANATDTLGCGGHGNPCKRTGMSRSPFRPSDDSTILQYHIPANAMAVVALDRTHGLLTHLLQQLSPKISTNAELGTLARACVELAMTIESAIETSGVLHGDPGMSLYCYETDGFGSQILMDDANVPNLLSLPYLDYCIAEPGIYQTYQNTRRFILSDANPYFHKGSAVPQGAVGGPHIGQGWIWPMSLITQAITSTDDAEILQCLYTLKSTHAGKGFMHEAFWKDDPSRYTRDWFAWANSFFGELILHVAETRPHLLGEMI